MTAGQAMHDGSIRPVIAHLGLGANLGDREAGLRHAVARLAEVPGVWVEAVSTLRETEPVGGPPQPRYLNGAVRVRTTLSPRALLAVLKALEREAGRCPDAGSPRDGPRPLDLDLLLFGDEQIESPDLTVPHPRILERAFVLDPLRELGVDVDAVPSPPVRPVVTVAGAVLAQQCDRWRREGFSIGLVPTMGALHEGHASLLRRARAECDRVVASIFVNPLQFAPHEDLSRYPRPLTADLAICRDTGVDVAFHPTVDEVYGDGFCSHVGVGAEAQAMEAAARPGHFSGVATVVLKLWCLAGPDRGYFGRKDAQQLAVIRRLHRDLGLRGEAVECDIVRERDGLAMSSRNVYLSPADRRAAVAVPRALLAARAAHGRGERDAAALVAIAGAVLGAEPRCVGVDYLELRRDDDLAPWPEGEPVHVARLLVAARFGDPSTRLLDNLTLGDPETGA